ncbi:Aste57867_14321 [Aphanomyces stellatus]|uniref:Aste57867_14321 protein n=1 Tax=Aphanomyces stellatus TaxID=120398 RepID=A0A485L0E0_9STRA|nr:hypothetical protein As57867_014267 [Aphanomyces stellatus]VFT91145.1 Aste57867_14321 [Aphanomyces stellatus]
MFAKTSLVLAAMASTVSSSYILLYKCHRITHVFDPQHGQLPPYDNASWKVGYTDVRDGSDLHFSDGWQEWHHKTLYPDNSDVPALCGPLKEKTSYGDLSLGPNDRSPAALYKDGQPWAACFTGMDGTQEREGEFIRPTFRVDNHCRVWLTCFVPPEPLPPLLKGLHLRRGQTN